MPVLQFTMRSVAERRGGGLFALAEPGGTAFFGGMSKRREAGSFVGTVAEGLGIGFSAGAEPDFLSGVQGDFDRLFGGDFGFHRGSKVVVQPVPGGIREGQFLKLYASFNKNKEIFLSAMYSVWDGLNHVSSRLPVSLLGSREALCRI